MFILGFVRKGNGTPIKNASIRIKDRSKDIYTWHTGEYWRLLLPGIYDIEASAPGFITSASAVQIIAGQVKILNFHLKPSNSNDYISSACVGNKHFIIALSCIHLFYIILNPL